MIENRQVTMAANGTADLITNDASTGFKSKLTPLMVASTVAMGLIATDANVRVQVTVGNELVVPLSPIPSGGTIGVFPKIPDEIWVEFEGAEADEISVELTNTGAGTPSVMATLQVEPLEF